MQRDCACLSNAALAFRHSELCIFYQRAGRVFRALKLAAQVHLAGRQGNSFDQGCITELEEVDGSHKLSAGYNQSQGWFWMGQRQDIPDG